MIALGLQGSPRKKGNSEALLNGFMDELARLGVHTTVVDVTRRHIEPCKEISVCETKGYCPIEDDMAVEIYPLLREADIIVLASPVFFYGLTAQLKAVIDRSQALWARKYKLKLKDPRHDFRRGYYLGVGATSGKKLFDGALLTVKYFFDGVAARFCGSLTFSGIEQRGQISDVPSLSEDIAREAQALVSGMLQRRRVLFAGREDACRSQMAAAFAQIHGGDHLDAACAGSQPAARISALMQAAMQEKGIDMAHRRPAGIDAVIERHRPHEIITMGGAQESGAIPGAIYQNWILKAPPGDSIEAMRILRDEIEAKIIKYIQNPVQAG